MSRTSTDLREKLNSLKAAFDRTFACPPPETPARRVRFLAIRVGKDPFALRIDDLTSLVLNRKIVPVLGGPLGFRGLAGERSQLVAVYSLASLLGQAGSPGPERWLARCRSQPSVGQSFDLFEGHLEVESQALHPGPREKACQEHVREVLKEESRVRGVVSIASILEAIERSAGPGNKT